MNRTTTFPAWLAVLVIAVVSFCKRRTIRTRHLSIAVCVAPLLLTGSAALATPVTSGLELWLKADSLGLSDGANVSSWLDSSSNGRAAEQGTLANQPTFHTNVVNGLPVVRFDGSLHEFALNVAPAGARALWTNLNIGSSGMTVMAVINPTLINSNTDASLLFGDENGMIGVNAVESNAFNDIRFFRHAAQALTGPHPAGFFIPEYVGSNMAASASNTKTVRMNAGALGTNTANNSVLGVGEMVSVGTDIVNNPGRPTNFSGDVAELLIYSRVLSESELNAVGVYLEGKYGLETAYVPEPAFGAAAAGCIAIAMSRYGRRRRR